MEKSGNLLDSEKEFEIAALRVENTKLRNEITKYQILLNEIDSEANPNLVTDEEAICVEQIRKLKESSSKRTLTTDEVKKLDLLHKNLKLARGEIDRVKNQNKAGQYSIKDLENIAKST